MSSNPTTCGNCHTENPPDQDFCTNCGQPLTRSAEEGLDENQEAQDHGGAIGGSSVGLGGVASPLITGIGTTDEDGRPPQ